MFFRSLAPSIIFGIIIVAVTKVNAQIQSGVDWCNGQCENGSRCVKGPPDFSEHSSSLSFHSETSVRRSGYHCQCLPGWTGAKCDIPYESCSKKSGEHHCFHGGKCIPGLIDRYGNEQLFCDCSNARDKDGNAYVGKYCEHVSVDRCDDGSMFCVNGGECDNNSPDGPTCICPERFDGPHCEFKAGSVPQCDLGCTNGGHCVFGDFSGPKGVKKYDFWGHEDKNAFMRCECPKGFDGALCEIEKNECGKGHCFHGSECVKEAINDEPQYFCNCNTANTDETSYAGRYCQYEATSYCTKSGDIFCVNGGTCKDNVHEGCHCPTGFGGFSCEFQVLARDVDENDGHYPTSLYSNSSSLPDQQQNTTVSAGLVVNNNNLTSEDTQFTLELANNETKPEKYNLDDPAYMECTLDCMNSGVCRKGSKNLGDLATLVRDIDHLNATHSRNFDHCVCPSGYTGLRCEHEIETCSYGEHHCLHGSQCVDNEGSHSCDCSTTTSDTISPVFAGRNCEHKATTICTKDIVEPVKPHSFCVNGGACAREVNSEERHPGCICLPGWDGPHCEIKVEEEGRSESNYSNIDNLQDETNLDEESMQQSEPEPILEAETPRSPRTHQEVQSPNNLQHVNAVPVTFFVLFLTILIVAVVGVLVAISTFVRKLRGKGRSVKSITIFPGGAYRDETSKFANVALASDKQVDPIPQRSFGSSAGATVVYDMASSDCTPEVGSSQIEQNASRKKVHQFSYGMESSDYTPGATAGLDFGVERAEFV